MSNVRISLTPTDRRCYRGHAETYVIQGLDQAARDWLQSWDLYCATCEALTIDEEQFQVAAQKHRDDGSIGFVTQVPIKIVITHQEEST